MTEIWFTATNKFDPSLGNEWKKYIDWANVPQLHEIISLDSTLRPKELINLVDADWEHNIHQNYLIVFFRDLDYLLKKFSGKQSGVNILAIILEPAFDVRDHFRDKHFAFQGYDLVGKGDVSVITNCGGFDKAFQTTDISNVGLFDSYTFARKTQKLLLEKYPEEYHADCDLWAIWKMIS